MACVREGSGVHESCPHTLPPRCCEKDEEVHSTGNAIQVHEASGTRHMAAEGEKDKLRAFAPYCGLSWKPNLRTQRCTQCSASTGQAPAACCKLQFATKR